MNQTTKETRRRSYDAVLPKRAARCRLILETLGNRELTASEITLTIELTPDDERRTIGVSVTAKSTLAATNPVATALYVTSDGNGELVVAEMVPQVPGQMNMDGTQQEAPKLLKLVQHA